MITGLTIVLLASLALFVATLAFALFEDLLDARSETVLPDDNHLKAPYRPKSTFDRAARRPMRFLGTFIL